MPLSSPQAAPGGLFVPDNLPKGHIVVDVKPKKPPADDSTSPVVKKPRTVSLKLTEYAHSPKFWSSLAISSSLAFASTYHEPR